MIRGTGARRRQLGADASSVESIKSWLLTTIIILKVTLDRIIHTMPSASRSYASHAGRSAVRTAAAPAAVPLVSPSQASQASQADSVTLELSSCQQVILKQLEVEARTDSATELFARLKHLERKEMTHAARMQSACDLMLSPGRTCCFDIGDSSPSWKSSSLCERCNCINSLLLVVQDSFAGSELIKGAVLSTKCDSELQRTGVTPTLSAEVIELILDSSLDHYCLNMLDIPHEGAARAEVLQQGRLIRALLQTSRLVRRRVTSKLPVRSPRITFNTSDAAKYQTSHVHAKLRDFVDQCVHWYLLDVSLKLRKPLDLPTSMESILVRNEGTISSILFRVTVAETFYAGEEQVGVAERNLSDPSASLTVGDACEVLREAMQQALPPPKCASLHMRSQA